MPVAHLGIATYRWGHTGGSQNCLFSYATFQGQRMAYNGKRPLVIFDGAAAISGNGGTVTGLLYCGTGSKTISRAASTQAQNTGWVGFTDGVYDNTPQTLQYGFKNANRSFWFAFGGGGEMFACPGNTRVAQPYRMWMDVSWGQVASAPTVTSIVPGPELGTMVVTITGPSDNGGATVTTYTHQFALNSSFTTIAREVVSPASKTTITGLLPGVTYFHRVMAVTAVSAAVKIKGGAASTTKSFTMSSLPGAPSLTVTTNPAGTTATVKVSPPAYTGGLAILDYAGQYEYLIPPPKPTPSLFSFAADSAGKVPTIGPLLPGASYRWRARARNSAGYGPYSAWLTVVQSKPSQGPGDYFDGAMPDGDDVTFEWTTSTDLSISTMTGQLPLGWLAATPPGGTGAAVLMRATGAALVPTGTAGSQTTPAGTYLAQLQFTADTNIPGTRLGVNTPVEVVAGETYTGSIFVVAPRSQRMAAEIRWGQADGTFISHSVGEPANSAPGTWRRYLVQGVAPEGAEQARIRIVDVAGSGWAAWRGGDVLRADAAMINLGDPIPYFSGGMPDTAQWDYAWTGDPNASTSIRSPQTTVIDLLNDPECADVPLPPRPPSVLMDCVEEIAMWQRRFGMVPKDDISDWLTMVPTVEFRVHDDPVRQLRLRLYPNPFDYHPLRIDTSSWCSEQIISYIPANSVMTLDGVTKRVWVEVGGGPPTPADHLLFGAEGRPAVWPELSCGISYLYSLDTSLDIGLEQLDRPTLYLTRRM